MEIGLISDTHGYLDHRVYRAFEDCDEIWHAGDFGDIQIANDLAAFRPFRGVFGNIDDQAVRQEYPEDLRFEIEGLDVWLTHIAGHPGRYSRRVNAELKRRAPGLLVCGHSHILLVQQDKRFGQMQYINPGAAGDYGDHLVRTLMKLKIENGRCFDLRVIELGPRGQRAKQSNG